MKNSGQNRARGDFQGPRPHKQTKRQGRRHRKPPEGEHQGPQRVRRNRRRNPDQKNRNRGNHMPRGRRPQSRHRRGAGWRPAAGFIGFDDRIEIIVELPGVEEKDISVSVAEKMLLVRGKKHQKQTDESHNFGKSELKYGKFHRAFPLPPMAKTDGIKADFKDGILTITIPKKEEAKLKEIAINTNADN